MIQQLRHTMTPWLLGKSHVACHTEQCMLGLVPQQLEVLKVSRSALYCWGRCSGVTVQTACSSVTNMVSPLSPVDIIYNMYTFPSFQWHHSRDFLRKLSRLMRWVEGKPVLGTPLRWSGNEKKKCYIKLTQPLKIHARVIYLKLKFCLIIFYLPWFLLSPSSTYLYVLN